MTDRTKDKHGPCPFEWGDRVDHPKFGLGTVASRPVAVAGPVEDRSAPGGFSTAPKGWRMEIDWDDPARPRSGMTSSFLSLVERPDAKGGPYWAAEYRHRLENTLRARRSTDSVMQDAFRSSRGVGAAELRSILDGERAGIEELLRFLDADEAGEHS